MGGVGGRHTPNIVKCARKLVKIQSRCKRVGHNIFCDLFLSKNSWSIDQSPQMESVSAHHCFLINYFLMKKRVFYAIFPNHKLSHLLAYVETFSKALILIREASIEGCGGCPTPKDLACRQICSTPLVLAREVLPSTPIGT